MYKQQFPIVSVCIPVFNGEKYIVDCINSVLDQKFTNFELLIIDNCSTDKTQFLVSNFNDKRIKYIRNKSNIGSINNFTKCVNKSVGKYFVLLPHDDLLLPNALEDFVLALENKNVGYVYSATQVIDENGIAIYKKINHKSNMKFTSEEALKDLIKNFMPIQLAMVRTKILKKIGGFDFKYSLVTDIHLWVKIIFQGWGAYYINTPKTCFRAHAEQGQRAFQNSNLEKLSEHWGQKLDIIFWEKNSYNYLLLKLTRFIFDGMEKKGYDDYYAKNLFIKMFVRSHMRSILLSLFPFNKFMLILEIRLFKKLTEQYNLFQIITAYSFVSLKEIIVRLLPNKK